MREVGVRDFRDHAPAYLSGTEPLAVRSQGRVLGFYFPVTKDQERIRQDLDEAGERVAAILEETRTTEDEPVDFLGPASPARGLISDAGP